MAVRPVHQDDRELGGPPYRPPLDLHFHRVGETAWNKQTGAKFSIADTTMQGRRFRTMPLDLNRPVRFVTGGDMMNTHAKLDKATANAAALDPDFALLVGDLAYANGVSSNRWVEWLKSWTDRASSRVTEGRAGGAEIEAVRLCRLSLSGVWDAAR